MTESPIKVGLIYGSTRAGRFCDTVARWAASQIGAREGFALEIIDPLAAESPGAPELKQRIAACDAFIVVTPEYNHGYPARSRSSSIRSGRSGMPNPSPSFRTAASPADCARLNNSASSSRNFTPSPFATVSASPALGNSSTPAAHCAAPSVPSDLWMQCSTVSTGGPSVSPTPVTSGLTQKQSSDWIRHAT